MLTTLADWLLECLSMAVILAVAVLVTVACGL